MIFAGITTPAPAEQSVAEQVPAEKPQGKRKRAHRPDGTFQADDPATPDKDEAFVEG